MNFFTFFGGKDKRKEVSESVSRAIGSGNVQQPQPSENGLPKPIIKKPQRLATIIEMNTQEHFEQPPLEEPPK